MSTDLILDSLRRRMRAMHSLYEDACATMNVEQVNHVEKEPCLPIAFSLFHYVNMEDGAYMLLTGEMTSAARAAEIPQLPEYGNLDLDDIEKSDYLFS